MVGLNLFISRAYGLYWIPLELLLVEAAGIEPASVSPRPLGTTCLALSLNLTNLYPIGRR